MTGDDRTHVAMTTGGAYSLATLGAKDVIDGAWPLVREAIERSPDQATRSRSPTWEPPMAAPHST